MYKPFIYGALLLSLSAPSMAQIVSVPPGGNNTQPSAESADIYLSITDPSIIVAVNPNGTPVFSDAGVNSLMRQYAVTNFRQSFPTSRFEYMRQVYELTANSSNIATILVDTYPQYFPKASQKGRGYTLAYYPSDYPNHWPCRPEYLGYVGAPDAWGITHGSSSVIVGVTDTYFDLTHPDFAGKIAMAGPNVLSGPASHGTTVAGLVACKTDNGTEGYPSMGFDTRLDVSTNWANDAEMLLMSQKGRRVINGSWTYGWGPTLDIAGHFYEQGVYNEIYENGTFSCFAAGNGPSFGGATNYLYPSSLNHVFSTTGIGWEGAYGTGTFNIQDVHEITIGDTINTHQHNSRVDLMAPSVRLGTLIYDPSHPADRYCWDCGWGTSFASPIVAGTAALLLSLHSGCLTPYQLEYILKKSAKSSVLSLPENAKYAGRLGAGKLEAGNAVDMAQNQYDGDCNNPYTQTFVILGVELNTICAPGLSSNGVMPQMTPLLKNGVPTFTYTWEAIAGNTTTLDNYNTATPTIISSTAPHVAYYRLTVYDGSAVQKVATKIVKVKLSTAADYDLAMRDSYADMLDEPNTQATVDAREWNIWLSPDIWNRQVNDGVLTHENPEYFISNPNFVYTRVRNVGCRPSPSSDLRLYWTKASTGEKWRNDWDGTTQVASSGAPLPSLIPGGGEITSGGPINIAPLPPGSSTVLVHPWFPTRPEDFDGSPKTVDACLLARIEDPHGMTIPEVFGTSVKPNILNNNNIITRNLVITNLNPMNKMTGRHRIDIASAEASAQSFNLQFISDRAINPHFSGNFTAVAYATLYLGDLFDRWMQGGAQGTYTQINEAERSVVFDGSQTLMLENIQLNPGERFPVDVEFSLLPGTSQVFENEFVMHLRQFVNNPQLADDVYGNVTFMVNTSMRADGQGQKQAPGAVTGVSSKDLFSVYPNPADHMLNVLYAKGEPVSADVTVYDVTGRQVFNASNQEFGSSPYQINIASFTSGVYFITVTNSNGLNEKYQFVKK